MRCLKHIKDFMFIYSDSDDLELLDKSSDFAVSPNDMKSMSSYLFKTAGGMMSWKSTKQTLTASFIM